MADNEIEIIIKGKDAGASKAFDDVRGSADKLHKAGGILSSGLDSLRGVMMNGLKVAAVGVTAALGGLVAGIGSSVNAAMDMEQQLADISASMGTTAEETGQLKNLITDLGLDPKLKVSATEAADAIQVLGTAGVDVTDILGGAARSTVLLANATGADFGSAAAIASDAMALWKVEAKDLDKVVNGVTATTIASKFGIDDYRLALAQAGGAAATLGVEFDDFNATIAAISPSFGSGSDAGTSFKTMLQRMVPQSKEATQTMMELGLMTLDTGKMQEFLSKQLGENVEPSIGSLQAAYKRWYESTRDTTLSTDQLAKKWVDFTDGFAINQFYDASGAMKGMNEISGLLAEATAGLSEEQKNAALSTIFGSDALRAAAAIADTGKLKFEELKATMAKTDAEEQAATRMNTFKGALEILSGVFETLKIQIGEKFLPVLTAMANKFGEFLTEHSGQIISWAEVLANKLEFLFNVIGGSLNVLAEFIDSGELLSATEFGLTGETARLADQLVDTTLAIYDTVSGIIEFIRESVGWKNMLFIVAGLFAASFIPVIISVVSTISTLVSGVGALITILGTALPALGAVVAAAAPVVLIIGAVATAAYLLYQAWQNNFLGIQDKTREAFEYIKGIFTNFPATIESVKQTLYDWGSSAMGKLREGLVSAQNMVRNGLDVVMDFLQAGRDQRLGPFAQSLYDFGSSAITKLGQGAAAVKDAVAGQFNQVMTDVQDQGLGFATGAMLGRMYEGGRSFLLKVGEGIGSASPGLKTNLDAAFNGLLSGFNYWKDNLAPHFLASAKDLFSRIATGAGGIDLGAVIDKSFESLRDAFNYWKDNLMPHFSGSMTELGRAVVNGISGGIRNGIGAVMSAIQGVTDALPQWVKDKLGIASPSKLFAGFGENIIQGLVQGMERLSAMPQLAMAGITDSLQLPVSNVDLNNGQAGNTSISNDRSTSNTFNVTVPGGGGNQQTGQLQTLFNTLTNVYAT